MTQTTVSPLVFSEEYNIATLLTDTSRRQIEALQAQFKHILGDAIWLTPSNCLHSTLMEVICDAEYRGLSKQEHFQHWYKNYSEQTKEIIAQFPAFSISFTQVIVSQRAIIIKAADSTKLNELRAAVLAKTKLPEGTKVPPDITHCSIARFAQSIDLEVAQEQTKALSISLTEHVTAFELMEGLAPPDFKPTILETYTLGQAS